MTDRNYTCVADAMQPSKKTPVQVGDIFTTNQGCKITVLKYESFKKVLIQFLDEYKHTSYVQLGHLKTGNIRNPYFPCNYGVGFVGAGKHKAAINKKDTLEYKVWSHMLERCYSKKYQETRPTYIGCTVCKEWHNFQNFAEWYTSQEYYGNGYHVEKDLLIDGNKVYSPKTCVLAPIEINNLLANCKLSKNNLPIGVSYHKHKKRYQASLCVDNKRIYLGSYETASEAECAYQKAKKANIKRMALKWKDKIDKKLFDALVRKSM